MIIVGYPGIGKTQLARRCNNLIDLDSSFFNDDYGAKIEDWAEIYVKMAIELEKQGNDVFISAHKEVRNWLLWYHNLNHKPYVALIYPGLAVKDEWAERICKRGDADQRALKRVQGFFVEDIFALDTISPLFDNHFRIDNMDYNLEEIYEDMKRKEIFT